MFSIISPSSWLSVRVKGSDETYSPTFSPCLREAMVGPMNVYRNGKEGMLLIREPDCAGTRRTICQRHGRCNCAAKRPDDSSWARERHQSRIDTVEKLKPDQKITLRLKSKRPVASPDPASGLQVQHRAPCGASSVLRLVLKREETCRSPHLLTIRLSPSTFWLSLYLPLSTASPLVSLQDI